MADTNSTVQFKADISQLKAAMQQASRQVRLASSEFKAATAGLDDWSNSAQGLNAKIKQLNSTLTAQKRQVALANEEYEKTVKVYGENSAEADRAKISLNNYMAAVAKTESQLKTYEADLKDCEEGTGRFAEETEDLEDATQRASDGFTVMKGALSSLVADGIRMAISAIKDLAKETFNVGMNFESAMSQVEAVSGATAEEIDALTEKAKEMGSSTKFTATEAAEAFNYMAMAGWKTEDMLGGIEGIMNLAAASGADLATTSDIVTDALTAMGYGAEDAGKLADVMAAASSNANTNVEMMGLTFQYAAPIIGALGMNMEDAAVAIGLMANAGIKGEKSGTALRSILTRLSAPPKECAEAMDELGISLTDSEGNMKDLDTVMKDLRGAFDGLSETQQTQYAKALAGQEAMSGLLAIVNAAPTDFDKLTKAVEESNGAAQAMADTMQDNVGGQITLLKSKIEGIMIKVFENASDSIKKSINTISDALDKVDWDKFGQDVGKVAEKIVNLFIKIVENGEGIVSVLKSIGTVLLATFVVNKITAFVTTITNVVSVFRALKTATEAATTAQKLLNVAQAATPIGIVTAAVAGLTTGLIYLASKTKEADEITASFTDTEKEQIDIIHDQAKAYQDLKAARDESVQGISAEYAYYDELLTELNSLVGANGEVKKGYEDRAAFIVSTLNEALGLEMELTDGVITGYQDEKQAIEDLIETKKAQAILSANEESYTAAIQNRDAALKSYTDAQSLYTQKQKEMNEAEAEAQRLSEMSVAEYAELIGMTQDYTTAGILLGDAIDGSNQKLQESQLAFKESKDALREAESTYTGYISTIQNYEGLSSAIISGDSAKIAEALNKLQNDFITAENGTRDSLERQLTNYENNLASLKQAIKDGTPGVTQEMVDQAEDMVDAAQKELDKLPKEAGTSGKKAGEEYSKGVGGKKSDAKTAGKNVGEAAVAGVTSGGSGMSTAGKEQGADYTKGVKNGGSGSNQAGKDLAQNAKSGADSVKTSSSGENFGQGFLNGIGSKLKDAWSKGWELAINAQRGLKAGQQEGSPSKLTRKSGVFFGEGYEIGIDSTSKAVNKTAGSLAMDAYQSLKKAQQEGSPSKLTYASGVNFTKGYINGIASMQKSLVKTVKSLTNAAMNQALNLKNYNFAEAAESAGAFFGSEISSKVKYMIEKMTYQNEQKLKDFDETISKLQEKMSKETNENQKKAYQNQINEQNKIKSAYQAASSQMISEFTTAMNQYQSRAQALIDATVSGISSKYQAKYDEFINKQEELISKLKGAGDLFSISGAGIMTVNDIKEQTAQIKEYGAKLQKIKGKVSAALFDEIASYDMDQGNAFMDRLLALSNADLKAYSDAYEEKMSIAEKLGESTYQKDIANVAKEYKTSIQNAFKTLPTQLEKIGTDTLKGFVNGFTSNTDYMESSIKTFVKGMVDQFKKELKIKSPSRVMMELGGYTGEGFVIGLKDMIGTAKDAAMDLAKSVSSPLDGVSDSIGSVRAAVGSQNAIGQTSNSIVNNYNLVQNNTSPKSLNALETYRARRQQIAMLKAVTQNS